MIIAENLIKSPHRGKWNGSDLILSKERVQEHGEVLTPPNIVSDMLDLVSEKYEGVGSRSLPLEKTFLEPSCGTGNFLVQILQRKLCLAESLEDIFKAVSTIYGVDIQKDNVLESRLRMLEIIEDRCADEKFLSIIADVLEKNIIGGDYIEDKYGCQIGGKWVSGFVSNSTGLVEENNISRTHGRIVMYRWTWHDIDNIESVGEFLYEKEEKPVDKVEVQSQEELMAKFKNMFGG